MKRITEHLFSRGQAGTLYCRIRIPTKLRAAYQGRRELVRSLGTCDLREGKQLLKAELAILAQEFGIKEREMALKAAERAARASRRLAEVTEAQAASMGAHWVHQALQTDELERMRGLDDEQFDELSQQLKTQREDLGRLLARGRVEPVVPALRSYVHLLGADSDFPEEVERRLAFQLLQCNIIDRPEHGDDEMFEGVKGVKKAHNECLVRLQGSGQSCSRTARRCRSCGYPCTCSRLGR